MKLFKQIAILLLTALLFVSFNGSIYFLALRRCTSNFGAGTQPKMIEVEKYLPFDENSQIVKREASLKLTDDLPVLDGATALLPVYSAIVNAVYPESSCSFENESFSPESKMQYRNTVGAYRAIVDGGADIVFCAAPSKAQLEYAEEKGVSLKLIPIGYEAFVFLVNEKNPVNDLTQEQIRGLFSGRYTNWEQVGGASRPVNALSRKEGSGSQTRMEKFMNGERIRKNPLSIVGGAIGFSFRYYVEGIVDNGGVKMLAVDGVAPTRENIQSKSYPLTNNFYAVVREDSFEGNVKLLVEWILSEEGQQMISESGYVGL